MLKKVITIAAMLVLVTLLAAPLVLAQQDASQEDQPAEGEAAQTPPASLG